MSAPRWEQIPLEESADSWGGSYFALSLGPTEEYVIDVDQGPQFQAMHNCVGEDRKLGPARKTLKAAYNDVGRDIRKRRAVLVVAGRAKLL